MSVTRVGGAIAAASARTGSVFAEASAASLGRVQVLVEQSVLKTNARLGRDFASLLAVFLTPAAMLALVFGLWRVSADLGWTESFVISSGLFSHWQVWMALAIALKLTASSLQAAVQNTKNPAEN